MREKNLGDQELLELARAYRDATREAGALFIMDDRIDIALAAQADGRTPGSKRHAGSRCAAYCTLPAYRRLFTQSGRGVIRTGKRAPIM